MFILDADSASVYNKPIVESYLQRKLRVLNSALGELHQKFPVCFDQKTPWRLQPERDVSFSRISASIIYAWQQNMSQ